MSQTLTISDALYSRLEAAARRRGLGNVEQLLETLPAADDDASRFQSLAQRWKKDTAHVSNIGKKALNPAYQEIIGMGKAAVPLLLVELRRAAASGNRRRRSGGSGPGAGAQRS
jgi:hypothetical protein